MKNISRYPFESLVVLILLYYDALVILFEPTNSANKFLFVKITVVIFLILTVFSFAFRKELDRFKKGFFSVFISGRYQKMFFLTKIIQLIKLSLMPFVLATLSEFLFTLLLTNAGGITVGFPLPVYSFSANRFLLMNTLTDLFVFMAAVYFVGYALIHYPDLREE